MDTDEVNDIERSSEEMKIDENLALRRKASSMDIYEQLQDPD